MDLSIIIVTWNVRDYARRCLNAVYDTVTGASFEVIVVDNHSGDGSAEMVRGEFPSAVLVENGTNRGFPAAVNQAIPLARAGTILLLNPDVIVAPRAIEETLEFLRSRPEAGIATCRKVDDSGSTDMLDLRVAALEPLSFNFPRFAAFSIAQHLSALLPENRFLKKRLFGMHAALYDFGICDSDRPVEVSCCTGAFMMIKKELISRIGMLDERFLFGVDDFDICHRARQASWKIFYIPYLQVTHRKERSVCQWRPEDKDEAVTHARCYFRRKHLGRARCVLVTLKIVSAKIAVACVCAIFDVVFFRRRRKADREGMVLYKGSIASDITNAVRVVLDRPPRFKYA